MKWRPIVIVGLTCGVVAGLVIWLQHARVLGSWLQVHFGIVNESGHYYAFWSGFGSDIAEFSILGAIATGIYQLVKKYNCHEPGCWRIGNHPAAGGQFASAIATTRTSRAVSQLMTSSSACTMSIWSARSPSATSCRRSMSV